MEGGGKGGREGKKEAVANFSACGYRYRKDILLINKGNING